MPRIEYVSKNFSAAVIGVITQANDIIEEYAAQGFALTLRQLYYQFVARDLIPNTQQSYKRIGKIVNDGRLAGAIDWEAITDRTRNLRSNSHWGSPASIIRSAAEGYEIDKWSKQPARVEVWIEKDALVGVIEAVCERNDVPFFSCRGYNSQSEMWRASQRLRLYSVKGQNSIIIHLGDHDPSGKDMTRDTIDRLQIFTPNTIEVRRIALNMDQVEEYGPPPNPTKITDSRAADYIAEFGHESWELDALEPSVIVGLIQKEIDDIKHGPTWNKSVDREDEERQLLTDVSSRWAEVVDFITGTGGGE